MLTNAMETQMVRSLGVKIGGRKVPAAPMEMVRSSLQTHHEEILEPADEPQVIEQKASTSEGKCPFTGMVNEAFTDQTEGPVWTEDAQERLERIPSFVRPMAKKSIEEAAQMRGYDKIDADVMDAVKGQFGF